MFKRIVSMFLCAIIVIGVFVIIPKSIETSAATEDNVFDAITDDIEFMTDEMAQSFIGFIYNVRADLVTDDMKSTGNIFNYITGRLSKGSEEYYLAQSAFLLTTDFFINKHVTEGDKICTFTTENLINILQKQLGGSENPADAIVNEAIGNVEKTIKKLLYYVFEYDQSDFFTNLDLAFSGYNTIVGIKGKVEKFVDSVQGVLNAYLLVTASNCTKAYNYFAIYVTHRYSYESVPAQLELALLLYNIGSVSELDGITIFFDKIGFGNSWTNKNVQHILRVFGEFVYHSKCEQNEIPANIETESISFATSEYTLFYNYNLTNPATVYPSNAADRSVTYYSGNTNIATVNQSGVITPVNPGTVTIYAQAVNGVTSSCTITVLPFKATENNGTYTITKYVGNGGAVTIPNYVNGKAIRTIGDSAFKNCKSITSITIPDSITSMGNYAFSGCSSLEKVNISDIAAWCSIDFNFLSNPLREAGKLYINNTLATKVVIPDGVKYIEDSAFEDCNSLIEITIPDTVTSIGYDAFRYCGSLEKVNISDVAAWCSIDFKGLESNPLYNARKLYINNTLATEIVIPDGVKTIKKHAFCYGYSLKNIIIPDSVTSIEERAFYHCTSLTSVSIPNSVKSIDNMAFSWCKKLETVNIPNGITTINPSTFNYCESLTHISLPDSVTSIGSHAFSNCNNLLSINIPNGVTSIGSQAFRFCNNLTNLTIPSNVASIGEYTFNGCTSMKNIEVADNNGYFYSDNGVLFNKDKTVLLFYPPKNDNTSYIIPNGVNHIDTAAFADCINLISITIPNSVESMGNNVFRNCTNLTNIIIPNSVKTMGWCCFNDCYNLKSITMSDNITKIPSDTFKGCNDFTIFCNIGNTSNILSSTNYIYKCFGDFDDDKKLSSTDMTKMRKAIFGDLVDEYDEKIADINQDDNFDARDLVRLKKKLAGIA